MAFIASIGYGAGYVVAKSRNHSEIVCLLISIIAGLILDAVGGIKRREDEAVLTKDSERIKKWVGTL